MFLKIKITGTLKYFNNLLSWHTLRVSIPGVAVFEDILCQSILSFKEGKANMKLNNTWRWSKT